MKWISLFSEQDEPDEEVNGNAWWSQKAMQSCVVEGFSILAKHGD
jgi:hypothetical protein